MEILLAFLILAIIITAILGSFNAVFSTTEALDTSEKYYDMAKNCLNRMSRDLDAIYVTQPPFYKKPEFDDPPDLYRIVGSSADTGGTDFASLRFASSSHISLDQECSTPNALRTRKQHAPLTCHQIKLPNEFSFPSVFLLPIPYELDL